MHINPILLAIEPARDAALWARPLNYHHLAYLSRPVSRPVTSATLPFAK